MTRVACSVVDCLRAVKARGLCGTHYNQWRRDNPASVGAYSRQSPVCTHGDCEAPTYCKGWCRKHYRRVATHGTPEPRFRGAVIDGKRVCADCKADVPVERFTLGSSYCFTCASRRTQRYHEPAEAWVAECLVCGDDFTATKQKYLHCSPTCKKVGINRRNWKHVQARRARQRAATTEIFHAREIYERDDWTCGLCGDPLECDKRAPHPQSPSIDHVIPIVLGGAHSRANTQAAHLGCNVHKGARLVDKAV